MLFEGGKGGATGFGGRAEVDPGTNEGRKADGSTVQKRGQSESKGEDEHGQNGRTRSDLQVRKGRYLAGDLACRTGGQTGTTLRATRPPGRSTGRGRASTLSECIKRHATQQVQCSRPQNFEPQTSEPPTVRARNRP